MKYTSSRGKSEKIDSSLAIYKGLADDGGLYIPDSFYKFNFDELKELSLKNYNQIAISILNKYLTDYTESEIIHCVEQAYANNFDDKKITPLKKINEKISVLELFHGPTLAFKDLALQILPKFMVCAINKQTSTNKIFILVATSGDTGKAALEGFKNAENIEILVLYPSEGVSAMQKLQMLTQEGNNVNVCGINGNFDDTQTAVKKIFTDNEIKEKLIQKGYTFSSANSMNWGRLVPQIIYYFSAYFQAVENGSISFGDLVDFAVPTGNFGDILAGYYAKKMGLPIDKLICASNKNNILTNFFDTGIYDTRREFFKTSSPSMDILISSNLERFLYDISEYDSEIIANLMDDLSIRNEFSVDKEFVTKMSNHIKAYYANEDETTDIISKYFTNYNYVLDPHTAVAACSVESESSKHTIIVSTASPYKFSEKVLSSLNAEVSEDEYHNLATLYAKSGVIIPQNIANLKNKKIIYDKIIEKDDILNYINGLIDNM